MIFEMWELIIEQNRIPEQKHQYESQKGRTEMTLTLLDTHWKKTEQPGRNTLDLEKENKQHLDQLGAKKNDQMIN